LTFTEKWLAEYQARMNGIKARPVQKAGPPPAAAAIVQPDVIEFTLSRPTPLLNRSLRIHWAQRSKRQRALMVEIASLLPRGFNQRFERAEVTITRYSVGVPDYDGMVGGAKSLIDCLHRLGIIRNDDPEHMATPKITSVRCATRAEQRTEVRVTRSMGNDLPAARS
jgi:hypothetical protein